MSGRSPDTPEPIARTSVAHIGRALLTLSMASIALMSIAAFAVSYHFLHQQTQRHLRTLMAVTVVESVAPLQFHDALAAAEVLQAIPREEGIDLAQMHDADGHVLAEIDHPRDRFGTRLATWFGAERLREEVRVDGHSIGSITLEGGSEPLLRVLTRLFMGFLLAMLVLGVLSLLVARHFTRRITHPILDLRRVMRRLLEDRDFSQRAPASDLVEVEDLRREFNALLDEIALRDRMLVHSNAALKRVAYVDSLTGLPNRAMFEQALLQAEESSRRTQARICLYYLDIDGFKQVNDTFGHAAGDALLAEIGTRLRGWQSREAIAARIGGDEFVLLVSPCGDVAEAGQLSVDLQEALDAPVAVAGHILHPGISVGYAIHPDMVDDADRLIEAADHSMYKTKQQRYRENRITRWEAQRKDHAHARQRENR